MSKGGKPKVESNVIRGATDTLLLDLDTEESVRGPERCDRCERFAKMTTGLR